MTQAFSIYSSDTSPAGDLAYIQDPLLVVDDGRYTHGVDGNVLPNTVLLDYKGNTIAGTLSPRCELIVSDHHCPTRRLRAR